MKLEVPASLKAEHEELHATLSNAQALSGNTGKAAKKIAALLHPHFVKEEEYALPPIGLLPQLMKGDVTPEMKDVLQLTDRLRKEYPAMLADHTAITAALRELSDAAKKENHSDIVHFSEKLIAHAKAEEELFYPMALIIGDYIRLSLSKSGKQIKSMVDA